jgi:hypothetical protein
MSDGTPNPATWPMWRGPDAYGQATAARIFRGGIAEHHTSVLTAHHGGAQTATPGDRAQPSGAHEDERGRERQQHGRRLRTVFRGGSHATASG